MGNRIMLGVPLVIGLVSFIWVTPRFFPGADEVISAGQSVEPVSGSRSAVMPAENPVPPSSEVVPAVIRRTPSVVIGARELVRIITPDQEMEIVAKIDTGADYSSIDRNLARSLGISSHRAGKKSVRNAEGVAKREVVTFRYRLGGREITSLATLADRSNMSTLVIIGKEDLAGFVVDVSHDFLTTPDKSPRS